MKRRLTAIVIAMAMVLSAAEMSFAASSLNIVSMGDSTSNGYGLSDYSSYGFGDQSSAISYPKQLKTALEKRYAEVNLTNMSLSGSMQEDYYVILNPSKYAAASDKTKSNVDKYVKLYFDGDINKASEYFRQELESAEIITFDCNMNNFGSGALLNLIAEFKGSGSSSYPQSPEAVEGVTKEILSECTQMKADANAFIKSSIPDIAVNMFSSKINKGINVMLCEYAKYCVSLKRNINTIRSINPNAELYVTGMSFNIMEGAEITVKLLFINSRIDVEELWKTYIDYVDRYVKTVCPLKSKYHYVKVSGVETFFDEAQSGKISQTLIDAVQDGEINSTLGSMTVASGSNPTVRSLGLSDDELKAVLHKAANQEIDAMSIASVIDELDDITTFVSNTLKNYDQSSEGEKAMLNVYMRTGLGNGIMVHPTEAGCKTKYNAIYKAVNRTYSSTAFVTVSLKASKRTITANWKAKKKATGYQLKYSVNSDMSSAKTKKIGKSKKTVKLSSLKKNTTYYVQMRYSYKQKGKTKYSDWSPIQYIGVK